MEQPQWSWPSVTALHWKQHGNKMRPTKSEHVIRKVRLTAPHANRNIVRLCTTFIWNPSSVSSSFLTLSYRDEPTFTFFRGVQSYQTLVCNYVRERKQERENLRCSDGFQGKKNESFNLRIVKIISLAMSMISATCWMTQSKWLPPNRRVRALHSSSSLVCRLHRKLLRLPIKWTLFTCTIGPNRLSTLFSFTYLFLHPIRRCFYLFECIDVRRVHE